MKENVLVLKTSKSFDAHLVVHCLSQKGECLSFWAPSALKSQKRFAGGALNPTHYISILYKKPPRPSGLDLLEEAILLKSFSGLNKSYHRMSLALYFLKLVLKVSQKGSKDNALLFHMTKKALETAETYSNLESLRLYFEFRLLEQQGVLPLLLKKEKKTFIHTVSKASSQGLGGNHKLQLLSFKNKLKTALSSYTGYSSDLRIK